MADSIDLQALEQAVAELNAAPPTGVPAATTRRVVPGDTLEPGYKGIGVFLGDEEVRLFNDLPLQDTMTRRRTNLITQCSIATAANETIDRAVDPLLQHCTATLGVTKLNGLVHYVREIGSARRAEQLNVYQLVVTIAWELSYQTLRNDRTLKNPS